MTAGGPTARRNDGHNEALADRGVVSGGCQITVRATIGYRDSNVGRSGLPGDRGKCQTAGCVGSGVVNSGRWHDGCVAAADRHRQWLGFACARRDAGERDRLQTSVILYCEWGDGIQCGRLIRRRAAISAGSPNAQIIDINPWSRHGSIATELQSKVYGLSVKS